jgi:hypothetical protein
VFACVRARVRECVSLCMRACVVRMFWCVCACACVLVAQARKALAGDGLSGDRSLSYIYIYIYSPIIELARL